MKRGIDDINSSGNSSECDTMPPHNPQTTTTTPTVVSVTAPSSSSSSSSSSSQSQQSSSSPALTNSSPQGASSSTNTSTSSSSSNQTVASPSSANNAYSPIPNIVYSSGGIGGGHQPIVLSLPPGQTTVSGDHQLVCASPGLYLSLQGQAQAAAAAAMAAMAAGSASTPSSGSGRPDPAKKPKLQRSQPSKVVHVRNIPQQITEVEVIQFGLIFGNIVNVLNLRSKCQAFLEFEKCEEAQTMINYFANNPISVAGRQIFAQYSNYKSLVTDPSNTNNQVARAALDLAKELHRAAQTGGANTVLRAMIQNMLYPVSLDTIYSIFSRFGPVLKIITFTKNDKFQALIQMKDAQGAQAAKQSLHGQNIYTSCCTLHIDYSKLNTLNVKYNNEKSRDYTNPLLPAGDCPDHLMGAALAAAAAAGLAAGPGAAGPGAAPSAPGSAAALPFQPIQISLAAAMGYPYAQAAANHQATGQAPPSATATQLPAGYQFAHAANPFIPLGKYLPQQTLLSAPTLLQPASNLTVTTASQAAAAAAAAAAANTANGAPSAGNNSQTPNGHSSSASSNAQSQSTAAMYSLAAAAHPNSAAAASQQAAAAAAVQNSLHHHQQQVAAANALHQHQQQQQQQQANLSAAVSALAAQQQQQSNAAGVAPMLIPFLSNLNEDAYIMMYTTT